MPIDKVLALGSAFAHGVILLFMMYYILSGRQIKITKEITIIAHALLAYLMVSAGVRQSWVALIMNIVFFAVTFWHLAKSKPDIHHYHLAKDSIPTYLQIHCNREGCGVLLPDTAQYCYQCGSDVTDLLGTTGETTKLRR